MAAKDFGEKGTLPHMISELFSSKRIEAPTSCRSDELACFCLLVHEHVLIALQLGEFDLLCEDKLSYASHRT